jgi:hypothetical protein
MVERMRILICGGREFTNEESMYQLFDLTLRYMKPCTIIQGGAIGADKMAGRIAREYGMDVEEYAIPDHYWKLYGKWEGPKVRNQDMLDTGIDIVYGFPGGPGTLDMKQRAKAEKVFTLDVW